MGRDVLASQIIEGDSLEVMRGMEADSVDLIAADPPYFAESSHGPLFEGGPA